MAISNKWTDDDINHLTKMYREKMKVKEIARILNRSESAIRNKAYVLKITNDHHFTEYEINYIKENYYNKNIREIAEDLGRGDNWQNVSRTGRRLGLTNKNRKKILHKETPKPLYKKWKRKRKYECDIERRKAINASLKKWHQENEHPRGMLGKTHSDKNRKRQSERSRRMWADPNSIVNSEAHRRKASERMSKQMVERIRKNPKSVYTNARGGTRKDLGFYVRSRWEANVARYLKFLEEKGEVYKWEYEPDTFWFENIKRGTRSYTPDFKVWESETSSPVYWEVKGYMDKKSNTRMKRMEKYYPDVKIRLIMKKEYDEISKWSRLIEHWEE